MIIYLKIGNKLFSNTYLNVGTLSLFNFVR